MVRTALFCIAALAAAVGVFPHAGTAASVRWETLPDRERVVISLNKEESFAGQVRRVEPFGLVLDLGLPPFEVRSEKAPESMKIFRLAEPRGRAIAFFTRTDAFGFVSTRTDRSTVVLDVFNDPMGKRWRPASSVAPAPAAQDAAPATPAVPDTPPTPAPSAPDTSAAPAVPESTPAPPAGNQAASAPAPGTVPAPTPESADGHAAGSGAPGAAAPSAPESPASQTPPTTTASPVAPVDPAPSAPVVAPPQPEATPAEPVTQSPAVAESAQSASPGTPGTPAATPPPAPVLPYVSPQEQRDAVSAGDALMTGTSPLSVPRNTAGAQPAGQPEGQAAGQAEGQAEGQPEGQPASQAAHSAAQPSGTPTPGTAAPEHTATAATPPQEKAAPPVLPGQNPWLADAPPLPDSPEAARTAADPAKSPSGNASSSLPVTAVRGRVAFDGSVEPIVPEEFAGVRIERPVDAMSEGQGAYVFRSPINSGDVSEWYEKQREDGTPGAATTPPKPAPPAPPPAPPANPEGPQTVTAPDGTQITYVDAEGKPVPAPRDPNEMLDEVRQSMAAGNFEAAVETVEAVLNHPFLEPAQREDALHIKSELLFAQYQDDLASHFEEITAATEIALNYNRNSPYNATALLRLGYVNLQVGNTAEATAYFNMLRSRYPLDENIPLTYYYWGDYYFKRGDFLRAADQYQYVVQHHAESPFARDASVGLTRSYMQLGYYPQAFQVVEYIESRWPRYYLEQPTILEMMGDVAFRLDNYDYALKKYWTYYNIAPKGPNLDVVLTRIGDIYSTRKQLEAAQSVYREAVNRFPDKDGGLVALMRLAEQGVNDTPTLTEMLSIFDGPSNLAPAAAYRKIINEHPESQLVPLAQLKLAMWLVWDGQYDEAVKVSSDLVTRFPDNELAERAQEVAVQAFSIMSTAAVSQGRTEQVQAMWDKYPTVRDQEAALSPQSRVALAVSLWQEGDPDRALAAVEPLFLGAKVPEYSEMALTLALSIFLDMDLWDRILALKDRVGLWELTPDTQRQLDYAVALAHENSDQSEQAIPLWTKLHRGGGLDDGQMAYAEFFLARDAEKKRDLKMAYTYGFSALNRFLDQARIDPAKADNGRITTLLSSLMDITEDAGRFDESLDYAARYLERLPANDPLRQGIQFRMSQIYKKQGNNPEWRRILTELVERDPTSFYGRTAASQLRGLQLSEEAAQFSPTGQL